MSFLGKQDPQAPGTAQPLLPCVQRILDTGLGEPSQHMFRLHALALGCRRAGYPRHDAWKHVAQLVMGLAKEKGIAREELEEAMGEVNAIVDRHYAPGASVGFNCSLKGLHEPADPLCSQACPRFRSIANQNLPARSSPA